MTDQITKPETKGKLQVNDINEMDRKIPRDLIIMYQGKPYITKAGLEWKVDSLYGRGNYSVLLNLIEHSPDYALAEASLKINEQIFKNYGEASKLNTAPMMQKQLVHLALTRAECRVLRMATACGYMSYEEMDFSSDSPKELPVSKDDGKPASAAQMDFIAKLIADKKIEPLTQEKFAKLTFGEAKKIIAGTLK